VRRQSKSPFQDMARSYLASQPSPD
jgi:hypothetical protein